MLNDFNESSKKAVDLGQRYIETSKAYFKLKIFQQLAISISLVGKVLAVGSFIFIAFLFFSIGAAIFIGDWLENMALGCIIVGAISLMIALLLFRQRKFINRMVITKLSKNF